MRAILATVTLAIALLAPLASYAQTPPPTVTATCKDGSPYSGTTKRGACRGHGGVQTWGAAQSSVAAPAPAPSATTSQPKAASKAQTAPASSGGAGQVWVNTASKVYHCQGERYYGKTKQGKYMSEPEAKADGDRPSGGKACS
jgi:hypothetical protein